LKGAASGICCMDFRRGSNRQHHDACEQRSLRSSRSRCKVEIEKHKLKNTNRNQSHLGTTMIIASFCFTGMHLDISSCS
jgi:hypothetical protein